MATLLQSQKNGIKISVKRMQGITFLGFIKIEKNVENIKIRHLVVLYNQLNQRLAP